MLGVMEAASCIVKAAKRVCRILMGAYRAMVGDTAQQKNRVRRHKEMGGLVLDMQRRGACTKQVWATVRAGRVAIPHIPSLSSTIIYDAPTILMIRGHQTCYLVFQAFCCSSTLFHPCLLGTDPYLLQFDIHFPISTLHLHPKLLYRYVCVCALECDWTCAKCKHHVEEGTMINAVMTAIVCR